ncbi:hypothetical protein CRG98_046975 [Punica granatum]|uniref:Uncharacterized protein n=1 Tax=Punica granatum TaxID=22663 RepID=A0A2I0HLR9_PUNGR|nr:hypothetical protein CRG98_046975 [Punica granatum]
MDLDEWELLPIDGFLDFGEDCEKVLLGKMRAADSTLTVFELVLVRIQLDPLLVENGSCEAREAREKNNATSVEEGAAADD